jgi:hypothetical protein
METSIHKFPKSVACWTTCGLVACVALSFLPALLLPSPKILPMLCFPAFVLTIVIALLLWLTRHWATVTVTEDEIEYRRWLGRTLRIRFDEIVRVTPDCPLRPSDRCSFRVCGAGRRHHVRLSWRLSDYSLLLQHLKQKTAHLSVDPQPRFVYDDSPRPTVVTAVLLIAVAALLVYPPGLGEFGKADTLGIVLGFISMIIAVLDAKGWPWVRREVVFENDRVVIRKNKGETVFVYRDIQSVEVVKVSDNSFSRYYSVAVVRKDRQSGILIGTMIPENIAHAMQKKWEDSRSRETPPVSQ